MTNCLELLGEIVAIYPVATGSLQFTIPFNVAVDRVAATSILVPKPSARPEPFTRAWLNTQRGIILDGYNIFNVNDNQIIMEPGTSVKESAKTATAGIYYTTKVSAKTYDDIERVRSLVNDVLDMESFDTFIVDDMERVFVLRAEEPACAISISANLPISQTHSIEIEVASVSGLIPVMFA